MCGIIGYIGTNEANRILTQGLEKLEYRGYDSAIRNKNWFQIKEKRSSYKFINNINRKMNSQFKNFEDIPRIDDSDMNILKFIKFDNYFCQINPSLRTTLKKAIPNASKISPTLNTSSQTVLRIIQIDGYWMNFQTLLNLSRLLKIEKEEVLSNITSIKTHNSFPVSFELKNLMTPSFFRLIGHILGDGGIHVIEKEGKYRAFYVNNEPILLESFTKDVEEIFNDVKLYSRKREDRGDEIWLPTTLGYLFYQIFNNKIKKEKRVPNFVFDITEEKLISPIIQALFDDEGTISVDKHMIVISLGNQNLLKDIKNLLEKINIKTNKIYKIVPKNSSIMYSFSITSKKNILDFAEKINFLHPKKRKRLETLVKKYNKVI